MPRVTLRKVAHAAGVSIGTASEALRGVGRISDGTRERIRMQAERLGYRPDPLLASLAARHFRPREESALPVAILTAEEERFADTRAMHRVAAQRASTLGYEPRIVEVGPGTSPTALTRMLFARGVVGIILALGRFRHRCPSLDWSRFSVVSAGPPPLGVDCDCAVGDHTGGMLILAERLAGLGYRRIGLAPQRHPEPHPDDLSRHAGALLARHLMPGRLVPPLLDAPLEDNAALVEWVRTHRPDAVATFHVGAWWTLREAFGERFTQAYASVVVPTGNQFPLEQTFAGLADVTEDCNLAAAELLDRAVRHRTRGLSRTSRKELVQLNWVEGASLRPAPVEAAAPRSARKGTRRAP